MELKKHKESHDEYRRRRIIRDRYNATFTSYNELYRLEQFEKYSYVIPKYNPQGIILDDGCGTALLLEYIWARKTLFPNAIKYYLCLDISPGMLLEASKTITRLGIDYLVDLVEADSENLPLRAKSVDIVYSFTVFMLLDHPLQGIREAKRVARRYVIYSILKNIPKLSIENMGKYMGETSKDQIFVIDFSQKKLRT
ncbi:MAG: class I SAM-dependent methyltransferase [Pyrodictiaceae archaeon]